MPIYLHHPGLPPSMNNAYFNLPRGGRALSKEGKKYKTEMLSHWVRNYVREMCQFRKNVPYLVLMTFYFDSLENAGYPKTTGTRYKKFDATNRPKLLEDVLKDATGVDDSQNLDVYLRKRVVAACPRMHVGEHVDIIVVDIEKEGNPFDGVIQSLIG